jgi:hypothetical protein
MLGGDELSPFSADLSFLARELDVLPLLVTLPFVSLTFTGLMTRSVGLWSLEPNVLVSSSFATPCCDDKPGTHSIRKGACSYILGFENLVCLSAVYLRMGWSLGNVQKRWELGVLGRTVAALNSSSERFALLPPHLSSENVMTIEQWQEAIPGFERFRVAIRYLTTSVVFHMEWLKLNLPANFITLKSLLSPWLP